MTAEATVSEQPFCVSTANGITTIEFNREHRGNSFPKIVWDTFPQTLRDADATPDSNVIVLTGRGRFFCTGGDTEAIARPRRLPTRVRDEGIELVETLLRIEKPIIAMVNGPSIGLGATIAVLCDCLVMAETAFLADPHVSLGIVAGDGGLVGLTMTLGPARSKEFVLRARRIAGPEAYELGLANRVVPIDQLADTTYELAAEFAAMPPFAVRATKMAMNRALHRRAHEIVDLSFTYESVSMSSAEHREAIARFRESALGSGRDS